jgi:putative membrane-bound dehydrogenase-like protein
MVRWAVLLLPLTLCPLIAANEETFPNPRESLGRIKVPEGFRVSLVAGEPTLKKPIAATTDERGRLWVVEAHSYPHWITDGKPGKDRILILEPDGNGGWSSKVFSDTGANLSGIAVGFGGVWLCAVPNLLFVPVKAGGDKPAGPPRIVLDGWNIKTKHNVFNSLAWGPDGWLYGCNGIQSESHVGAPGTAKDKRVPLNCGVWRFHPTRRTFEVVAHGTTNPWGLDWNEHGELFITNCVIKHLFHVVPGAHFVRMYGQDLDPHCYGLIESCADHLHWGGGDWTSSRGGKGAHSVAGGGHAHAGAMFYLGDNWPAEYRNRVFMGNIHGNRLNSDRLQRVGSTYVARHCDDFLFGNDPWFRPLWLYQASDGGMFVGDWHDTGECHNYDKTHPSGRVYHIAYGKAGPGKLKIDLPHASEAALVEAQKQRNDWYARQSRRLLQERAAAGTLGSEVRGLLARMLATEKDVTHRLRALWTLHAIGAAEEKTLLEVLDSQPESLRIWSVRLLVDREVPSDRVIDRFVRQAKEEKSAPVRLALASALQKLPAARRWELAEALAAQAKDTGDPCLPLMVWYGIAPAVPGDPERAARLAGQAKMPIVRRHIARRLAALAD